MASTEVLPPRLPPSPPKKVAPSERQFDSSAHLNTLCDLIFESGWDKCISTCDQAAFEAIDKKAKDGQDNVIYLDAAKQLIFEPPSKVYAGTTVINIDPAALKVKAVYRENPQQDSTQEDAKKYILQIASFLGNGAARDCELEEDYSEVVERASAVMKGRGSTYRRSHEATEGALRDLTKADQCLSSLVDRRADQRLQGPAEAVVDVLTSSLKAKAQGDQRHAFDDDLQALEAAKERLRTQTAEAAKKRKDTFKKSIEEEQTEVKKEREVEELDFSIRVHNATRDWYWRRGKRLALDKLWGEKSQSTVEDGLGIAGADLDDDDDTAEFQGDKDKTEYNVRVKNEAQDKVTTMRVVEGKTGVHNADWGDIKKNIKPGKEAQAIFEDQMLKTMAMIARKASRYRKAKGKPWPVNLADITYNGEPINPKNFPPLYFAAMLAGLEVMGVNIRDKEEFLKKYEAYNKIEHEVGKGKDKKMEPMLKDKKGDPLTLDDCVKTERKRFECHKTADVDSIEVMRRNSDKVPSGDERVQDSDKFVDMTDAEEQARLFKEEANARQQYDILENPKLHQARKKELIGKLDLNQHFAILEKYLGKIYENPQYKAKYEAEKALAEANDETFVPPSVFVRKADDSGYEYQDELDKFLNYLNLLHEQNPELFGQVCRHIEASGDKESFRFIVGNVSPEMMRSILKGYDPYAVDLSFHLAFLLEKNSPNREKNIVEIVKHFWGTEKLRVALQRLDLSKLAQVFSYCIKHDSTFDVEKQYQFFRDYITSRPKRGTLAPLVGVDYGDTVTRGRAFLNDPQLTYEQKCALVTEMFTGHLEAPTASGMNLFGRKSKHKIKISSIRLCRMLECPDPEAYATLSDDEKRKVHQNLALLLAEVTERRAQIALENEIKRLAEHKPAPLLAMTAAEEKTFKDNKIEEYKKKMDENFIKKLFTGRYGKSSTQYRSKELSQTEVRKFYGHALNSIQLAKATTDPDSQEKSLAQIQAALIWAQDETMPNLLALYNLTNAAPLTEAQLSANPISTADTKVRAQNILASLKTLSSDQLFSIFSQTHTQDFAGNQTQLTQDQLQKLHKNLLERLTDQQILDCLIEAYKKKHPEPAAPPAAPPAPDPTKFNLMSELLARMPIERRKRIMAMLKDQKIYQEYYQSQVFAASAGMKGRLDVVVVESHKLLYNNNPPVNPRTDIDGALHATQAIITAGNGGNGANASLAGPGGLLEQVVAALPPLPPNPLPDTHLLKRLAALQAQIQKMLDTFLTDGLIPDGLNKDNALAEIRRLQLEINQHIAAIDISQTGELQNASAAMTVQQLHDSVKTIKTKAEKIHHIVSGTLRPEFVLAKFTVSTDYRKVKLEATRYYTNQTISNCGNYNTLQPRIAGLLLQIDKQIEMLDRLIAMISMPEFLADKHLDLADAEALAKRLHEIRNEILIQRVRIFDRRDRDDTRVPARPAENKTTYRTTIEQAALIIEQQFHAVEQLLTLNLPDYQHAVPYQPHRQQDVNILLTRLVTRLKSDIENHYSAAGAFANLAIGSIQQHEYGAVALYAARAGTGGTTIQTQMAELIQGAYAAYACLLTQCDNKLDHPDVVEMQTLISKLETDRTYILSQIVDGENTPLNQVANLASIKTRFGDHANPPPDSVLGRFSAIQRIFQRNLYSQYIDELQKGIYEEQGEKRYQGIFEFCQKYSKHGDGGVVDSQYDFPAYNRNNYDSTRGRSPFYNSKGNLALPANEIAQCFAYFHKHGHNAEIESSDVERKKYRDRLQELIADMKEDDLIAVLAEIRDPELLHYVYDTYRAQFDLLTPTTDAEVVNSAKREAEILNKLIAIGRERAKDNAYLLFETMKKRPQVDTKTGEHMQLEVLAEIRNKNYSAACYPVLFAAMPKAQQIATIKSLINKNQDPKYKDTHSCHHTGKNGQYKFLGWVFKWKLGGSEQTDLFDQRFAMMMDLLTTKHTTKETIQVVMEALPKVDHRISPDMDAGTSQPGGHQRTSLQWKTVDTLLSQGAESVKDAAVDCAQYVDNSTEIERIVYEHHRHLSDDQLARLLIGATKIESELHKSKIGNEDDRLSRIMTVIRNDVSQEKINRIFAKLMEKDESQLAIKLLFNMTAVREVKYMGKVLAAKDQPLFSPEAIGGVISSLVEKGQIDDAKLLHSTAVKMSVSMPLIEKDFSAEQKSKLGISDSSPGQSSVASPPAKKT